MKKKTVASSVLLSTAFCMLLFTQCKKSNNDSNKSKLLVSGAWKFKEGGLDLDNNGTGETPFPTGTLQTCDIDNTVTFKTDTSGVVDEGATKCDATYPQTTPFKYTYNASSNILNFSTVIFAGLSGDVKVLDISSTQLKISKAVPITGLPTSVTVVVTLVH
ncbi:MAG: hypothetical protein INR73_20530 [Williamsia sp.]|nr:hypothetical protein [Williamsia sp.]